MADQVKRFTATFAAGTPVAAPATVDISFPPGQVRTIDWRVPPGPAGVMGWRLTMGGVQVIPDDSDPWVIEDNHSGTFTLTDYPDSGAWQVTGYNTGVNNHSVYLVFHIDLLRRAPELAAPLDPRSLMPSPDLLGYGRPLPGWQ